MKYLVSGESIAARYDLIVGPNPVPVNNWFTAGPSGAIDAKITSAKNMLAPESSCCQSSIICGPTHVDQVCCSQNATFFLDFALISIFFSCLT
jgi:hypothetical protein